MATQVASPHSPRAPQNIQGKFPPLRKEDIGSVLERFHKWAGNQADPVRELTYEEALKRSRRRVYAEEEPVHPKPVKAATSQESKPQPAAASKPPVAKAKTAKSAPVGSSKAPQKASAKPARAGSKKTGKKVSRKTAAQSSPENPAEAEREYAHDAPAETSHASAASAYQAVQQAAAEIVPPHAPTPTFEQVLAAQIHPPAAPLAIRADSHPVAPLPANAPAVHLTVRLATHERDAVRERAHDLGITPADYMRCCFLEIDSLRAELESVRLACAHNSAAAFSANPADSSATGGGSSLSLRQPVMRNHSAEGSWLTRIIRFILTGKANSRELSINA